MMTDGINTANFSKMFLGTNEGFYALGSYESGLKIKGEIRDIQKLKLKERINYIFAINNSSLKFYERDHFFDFLMYDKSLQSY